MKLLLYYFQQDVHARLVPTHSRKQTYKKWPDFYFCIFLFIYIYLIYYGKKREVKNEYCYLSERLKCSEGTEEGVVGGGGLF
jgi:hypothetical protein